MDLTRTWRRGQGGDGSGGSVVAQRIGLPGAVDNLAMHSLVAAYAARKPSSTNPALTPPSPKSRQIDHHPDT